MPEQEFICHLPIFESEEEEMKHLEKKRARHALRVAEREQIITTLRRPYPHQGLTDMWYASLVGDWRTGTGDTEEQAIGNLWLMYAHEIIEKCKG